MKMRHVITVVLVLLLVSSVATSCSLGGSSYPEKPITLVVHAAEGGGSDIFARTFAASVEQDKLLPQAVIVENKPGGSGAVAFNYVAEQKGSPYFLLTAVASFLTTPLQGKTSVNYKDFTPIANLAFDEYMVLVNATSRYQTMADLVNDARGNPGGVTAGGTQLGASDSICIYLIEKEAGVKFNYMVFDGGGEVNTALLGGDVDFAVANPGEALQLAREGKVRVLGVFAEQRLAGAPDVPTMKEQGINAVFVQNRGLVAPGNIPAEARKVLEAALLKYTQTETYKKYIADNLLTAAWMDGPTFGQWLEEWNAKYAAILKDMGVIQ